MSYKSLVTYYYFILGDNDYLAIVNLNYRRKRSYRIIF